MGHDQTLPPLLQHPEFVQSAHEPHQWLPDTGAEVAFAGRSNVGKSSAINVITQRRGLARTSKTPGRTQQIVFFRLSKTCHLVDLPGYGYAKVPNSLRQHWQVVIEKYLLTRRSLRGLVLVMDARHPLTQLDQQMLAWCSAANLALLILLTKADKLGRAAARDALRHVTSTLAGHPAPAAAQLFSARDCTGVAEAREHIVRWLTSPGPQKSPG